MVAWRGLVLAASVVGLLPFAASADTITEDFTITVPVTTLIGGFEDNFSSTDFQTFDPSLGTLNSVTFSLTGDSTVTTTTNGQFFSLSLLPPTGEHVALANAGETLFIFSGVNSYPVSFTGTANSSYNSDFVGTGQTFVYLDVDGLNGDKFQTNGALSGSVTYNYTEAAPVPEPATLSLLGFGVAALAFARRRAVR